MSRPDHVVLAGHTGRLMARAGLTCLTQWEVDEHVVTTVLAAADELGRPVTGPEVLQLWQAGHETWAYFHPPAPDRVTALLERIGKALADPRRQGWVAAAQDRQQERHDERQGTTVLQAMAAAAPGYQRDRLPDWITNPSTDSVEVGSPW